MPKTVTFKTAEIAPVNEHYRNFLHSTRQRDINAYNRISNPYYIPPSFNKPFLSYEYKTESYQNCSHGKLVLAPVKPASDKNSTTALDALSIEMLKYTVGKLITEDDEVFILMVMSKYDMKYHDSGYYLTNEELEHSTRIFNTVIVPTVQKQVLFPNSHRPFRVSINLVFDPQVIYTIEDCIVDLSPNIVIVCDSEDSGHEHKRSKLFHMITGSVTSYCINKLSNPVIVFTRKQSESLEEEQSVSESQPSIDQLLQEDPNRFSDMLRFTSSPYSRPSSRLSSRVSSKRGSRSPSPMGIKPMSSNPLAPMRSYETSKRFSDDLVPYASADGAIQRPSRLKRLFKRV